MKRVTTKIRRLFKRSSSALIVASLISFLIIQLVAHTQIAEIIPAAAGDLDPTFGSGGKVTTPFSAGTWAKAIAIAPDGKIVMAGILTRNIGASDFAIARYN